MTQVTRTEMATLQHSDPICVSSSLLLQILVYIETDIIDFQAINVAKGSNFCGSGICELNSSSVFVNAVNF